MLKLWATVDAQIKVPTDEYSGLWATVDAQIKVPTDEYSGLSQLSSLLLGVGQNTTL